MPTNIQFLADFLNKNPGATSVQARRALCEFKRKEYKPGQYVWYFGYAQCPRLYGYWEQRDGGWYLTEKGRTKLV